MKTLIAVPCMDQVPMPFCQSLAMLKKVGQCKLAMQCGSLIYTSRDTLAMLAISNEVDYILWLDSDMAFEPDILERMLKTLEENDLDVLAGLYYRRVPPYSPVLYEQLDIEGEDVYYSEYAEIPDGLFEVAACGFGCVLMRAEVFLDVQSKFGQMFTPIGHCGEDVSFCWRVRQCGIKIWCDSTVQLGHVGYRTVSEALYKAYQGVRNDREGKDGAPNQNVRF